MTTKLHEKAGSKQYVQYDLDFFNKNREKNKKLYQDVNNALIGAITDFFPFFVCLLYFPNIPCRLYCFYNKKVVKITCDLL